MYHPVVRRSRRRAGATGGSCGAVLGGTLFPPPRRIPGRFLKHIKEDKPMLEKLFLRLYIYLANLNDCIISLLRDKSASAKIPKRILDELARCFLPDIIAYYETVEGREEYEKWKLAQTQQTHQNSPQSP